MIYFIADTHFYDNKIIPYKHRPFESLNDMHEKIIYNWNNTVKNNDTVYLLGDFGWGTRAELEGILERLNGIIILVEGNHDRDKPIDYWKNLGFYDVVDKPQQLIIVDKTQNGGAKILNYNLIISHEPQPINDNQFNIHGHIHDEDLHSQYPDLNEDNHICVSVERTDYRPISITEIYDKYIKNMIKEKEGK